MSKSKSAKGRAFRGWLQAALMIYERVAISVWEEAVLSPLRGELLIDNLDNCIVITKASRAYAHTLALATNKTSKFSPISGLSQSVMVLRPPTDPVTHKGWSLLHRFHAMQVILTHARWPRRGRSPPTRTVTRPIAERGRKFKITEGITCTCNLFFI